MKVDIVRQIDASERNSVGLHDCFYEHDDFTFSDEATSYLARSYADEPHEASFRARSERGVRQLLTRRTCGIPCSSTPNPGFALQAKPS